jgi:hypothetical protein
MTSKMNSLAISHTENKTPPIEHPLPDEFGFCMLIHDFLSADECSTYIDLAESNGFLSAETDYPPSYRNNSRLVMDDGSISERLFQRLQQRAPSSINKLVDDKSTQWEILGINDRIRFCRYDKNQQFQIHQDGVHFKDQNCQSKLTFMIYLTDGGEFEGGDTVFFNAGPESNSQSDSTPNIIARIRPTAGTLIVFDHSLWHSGETVTKGIKHIMRSDLMYRRLDDANVVSETPFTPAHLGYIWAMSKISEGRIASGGRDKVIRIWNEHGRVIKELKGHSKSVLGLTETNQLQLASVSRDRTLRLWEVNSGINIKKVNAHDAAILGVAKLFQKGLATCSADHTIKLWTDQLKLTNTLSGHSGWIWDIIALSNEKLVSVSEDGSTKIWDIETGQCLHTLIGNSPLRCITASSEFAQIASGDNSGLVTLWNVVGNTPLKIKQFVAHNGAVRRTRFLSSKILATAGEDKLVNLWDITDGTLIQSYSHNNFVTDILYRQDQALLSCSYDGQIKLHLRESINCE